ncbi:MAG: SDR family oxidoreductase [Bacteroidetes bacterium]|nr:SDR family oxidoreductase [Bacteroidota bacterium]
MNILITGASRGIGRAIAIELARAGYRVALVARNEEALVAVARESEHEGGIAIPFVCDITDSERVGALRDHVTASLGTLDVLINNAGVAPSLKVEDTTDLQWHSAFATNVDAAFYLTRAFAADLKSSREGRIINIASTAALEGFAYTAAYTASKHALLGFARAIAKEFARSGVTVTTICPGFVRTDILEESIANIVTKTGKTRAEAEAQLGAMNRSGSIIEPEAVAHEVLAALAFASNPNGYEIIL